MGPRDVFCRPGSYGPWATGPLLLGGLAILFAGGWIAEREALESEVLYKITTKDTEYNNVRLVRTSSSGFIISRDRQIIFLPAGEVKSVVLIRPL
jgi:hypothetical protein